MSNPGDLLSPYCKVCGGARMVCELNGKHEKPQPEPESPRECEHTFNTPEYGVFMSQRVRMIEKSAYAAVIEQRDSALAKVEDLKKFVKFDAFLSQDDEIEDLTKQRDKAIAMAQELRGFWETSDARVKILENPSDGRCMDIFAMRMRNEDLTSEVTRLREALQHLDRELNNEQSLEPHGPNHNLIKEALAGGGSGGGL